MTQDEFVKQYLNTGILILAEYTNDTTVLCFQGIPGIPGIKVSSNLYNVKQYRHSTSPSMMTHRHLPNHSFLFCPLQGDPGGVIGIVPLKGDRGFPGTPGLPVRHVFKKMKPDRQTFLNVVFCNWPTYTFIAGTSWTCWACRTSRTSWLWGTQSELLWQLLLWHQPLKILPTKTRISFNKRPVDEK